MKQGKVDHIVESQCASTVLMIRPANFGFNEETSETNAFQQRRTDTDPAYIMHKAKEEFDLLVCTLKEHQIKVIVIEDTPWPVKPDAVFPNNWITTHADGTLITYPMYSASRRYERRDDIIDTLTQDFLVHNQYSFDHYELDGKILEGTGSMILDRVNHVVYACTSPRTDLELLEHFALLKQYRKVIFHSADPTGKEVYHTNVVMALGTDCAVICLESIADEAEREALILSLQSAGKTIISISWDQVIHFAGNMLQIKNQEGELFWVMSQAAYESLDTNQTNLLTQNSKIISSPIPTIERYGGGSVRCMIAEVFLNKRSKSG